MSESLRWPVCYQLVDVSSDANTEQMFCANCGSSFLFRRHGRFESPQVRDSWSAELVQPGKPSGGPYFQAGDAVRVRAGPFESFEGKVVFADAASSLVSVVFNIFERDTVTEIWKHHLELL